MAEKVSDFLLKRLSEWGSNVFSAIPATASSVSWGPYTPEARQRLTKALQLYRGMERQ